ncbi:MAG: S8 family serine peptidase, partial [Acidobacteriota bacterium]
MHSRKASHGASSLAWPLALLFLICLWPAAAADASQPVRVLIAEDRQPHLSQIGCSNGPGITQTCRVLMRIHCPPNGGGTCYENAPAATSDHATTVTKLAVYESDPDVQAIVASGSPHHALSWAIRNQERFNIRVVTRTDGTAQPNGGCSSANIFRNAFNAGIAVVYAAGNQGHNGIALPTRQVIPGSCGHKVIGVGFTGRGFVTRDGSQGVVCSDDPPVGGDNTNADVIRIDCASNARPGSAGSSGPFVDFFTSGDAVPPSVGSGSSFAAPRIAALFANYFTQNPNHPVEMARAYIDGSSNTSPLDVESPLAGVADVYRQVSRPEQLGQALSTTPHVPGSGYYYNPARSGWGLHVSTIERYGPAAGTEVHLIWYTYDAGGEPIWFTAFGRANSTGRIIADIRKEKKLPNMSTSGSKVGSVTLDFINETAEVESCFVDEVEGHAPD